jgi:septal ring-binding cell division protein DamX
MDATLWQVPMRFAAAFLFILGLQLGTFWTVAHTGRQAEPRLPSGNALDLVSGPPAEVSDLRPMAGSPLAIRRDVPLRRLENASESQVKQGAVSPPLWSSVANLNPVGGEVLPVFLSAGIRAAADGPPLQREESESPNEAALKANEAALKAKEPQNPKGRPSEGVLQGEAGAEASPAPSKASSSALAVSSEIQEPLWLQAQDPKRYTVQLYRSRNLNDLLRFARRKALPQPLAYYLTAGDSGSWYMLVGGNYPSRSAAQAVVAELLIQLPKLKPWVRDFARIQEQVR